jgi:hypothetical protein
MSKTLSYENKARKNQTYEKDITDKFKLIRILKTHFGLTGLTGEAIFIRDNRYRLPDVFVKSHVPMLAIELDGPIHGNGDPISKLKQDTEREADYDSCFGIKLIVINKQLTNGYDSKDMISVLEYNGIKRISNGKD